VNQDELKQAVAQAALDYIRPRLEKDTVIGVGTGSTANCFIDLLGGIKAELNATVASSEASAERLRGHGILLFVLDVAVLVFVIVDGADDSNSRLQLIKVGGGGLTLE
jgi:ribose 5-phosphate isomerase A